MPDDHDDVMEKLCELAHRLWCVSMEADGWKRGAEYNQKRKTHPDLCAYAEIAPVRRRFIADWIRQQGAEKRLIEAVDFAMRWDEWTPAELRAGLRVQYRDEHDADAVALGRIADWKVSMPEADRIDSFRVEWDDGTLVEYPANARYISQAEGP